MNETTSILNDEDRFDRLVDGELSAEQYRELLRSLDVEPDGWRRCAMAFLEAQAWANEVRPNFETLILPTPKSPRKDVIHGRPWSVVTSMAICFLVALGLGIGIHAWWPNSRRDSTASERTNISSPITTDMVAHGKSGNSRHETPPAMGTSTVPDSSLDPNVQLVSLPLYELDDDRAMQVLGQSALSLKARRSLQQLGYDVSEQRQYAPVQLSDGSRALVPIDEVQITPVARRPF